MTATFLVDKVANSATFRVMTIRDYLTEEGITAAEFGRRINVSRSQMIRYITGERRIPAERAIEIERASDGKIRREELRPDLFNVVPELAE